MYNDNPAVVQLRNKMLQCVLHVANQGNGAQDVENQKLVFWYPVSTVALPDYLEYCERTIDLNTIFCKALCDGYVVDAEAAVGRPLASLRSVKHEAKHEDIKAEAEMTPRVSGGGYDDAEQDRHRIMFTAQLAFEDDLVDMLLNCVAYNSPYNAPAIVDLALRILKELPNIFRSVDLVPVRRWLRDSQHLNVHDGVEDDDDDEDEDEDNVRSPAARRRRRARQDSDARCGTAAVAPARAAQSVVQEALQRIAASPCGEALGVLARVAFDEGTDTTVNLLDPLRAFFQKAAGAGFTIVNNWEQWLAAVMSASYGSRFALSADEVYRQLQLIIAAAISQVREEPIALLHNQPRLWAELLRLRVKIAPRAFRAASESMLKQRIPAMVAGAPSSPASCTLRRRVESMCAVWIAQDLWAEQQHQQNRHHPVDPALLDKIKMLVALTKTRPEAEEFRYFDLADAKLNQMVASANHISSSIGGGEGAILGAGVAQLTIETPLHLIEYRLLRGIAPSKVDLVDPVKIVRAELNSLVDRCAFADPKSVRTTKANILYKESQRFLSGTTAL